MTNLNEFGVDPTYEAFMADSPENYPAQPVSTESEFTVVLTHEEHGNLLDLLTNEINFYYNDAPDDEEYVSTLESIKAKLEPAGA
jgi:hypothetical protein